MTDTPSGGSSQSAQTERVRQLPDLLMAVLGFLELAESSVLWPGRRAELEAIAAREAKALKDLLNQPLMFIVARDRPEHRDRLQRAFGADPQVTVILDRRHGERRQCNLGYLLERRRGERRENNIDNKLCRVGVALARPQV
jgi:hypothetical protein